MFATLAIFIMSYNPGKLGATTTSKERVFTVLYKDVAVMERL